MLAPPPRVCGQTHASTHATYSLELQQAFEIERHGEAAAFAAKGEAMGNRQLLWHGSRLSNMVGILSQGLRIAPPEAPVTGYMFGKGASLGHARSRTYVPLHTSTPCVSTRAGVYFANMSSKSANYCFANSGASPDRPKPNGPSRRL